METAGAVFVLLSVLVFLWACLGLIDPKWALLRVRLNTVAVWAVSVVLLLGGSVMQQNAQQQQARGARDRLAAERARAIAEERQAAAEARARRTPEEIAAEQARIDAINAANRAEYESRVLAGTAQQQHTAPATVGESDGSWCGGYRAIRTSDAGGSSFDQVKELFPSGPNSRSGETYRWDLGIFGDPVTLWVDFNSADRAIDKAQEGMCY